MMVNNNHKNNETLKVRINQYPIDFPKVTVINTRKSKKRYHIR